MAKKSNAPANVSRREFGYKTVFGGMAAAIGVGPVAEVAQDQSAPALASDSDVEARFQRILRNYGTRLSEEQKVRLRKILQFNEKMLEPIRNFPLENGQAPASTLKLYPTSTKES